MAKGIHDCGYRHTTGTRMGRYKYGYGHTSGCRLFMKCIVYIYEISKFCFKSTLIYVLQINTKTYPDELLLLPVLLLSVEQSHGRCFADFEFGSKSLSLASSSEGVLLKAGRTESSSWTYLSTDLFLILSCWSIFSSLDCNPL